MTNPTTPTRIFIASSSRALGIAENLQHVLTEDLAALVNLIKEKDPYKEKGPSKEPDTYEIEVWNSVFPNNPSEIFVHILQSVTVEFDFAVVILTPDHKIIEHGQSTAVSKSNVVLELGLFIGSWGLKRVLLVEIPHANLEISDLAGVELARLNLPDGMSYEQPKSEDVEEVNAYHTNMRRALRKDVSPCMASMIYKRGRRGLSVPLDHIVQTTRELESLYSSNHIVDQHFRRHLGRHMENFCRKWLAPARNGELELLFPEQEGLAAILEDAENSAKAVAHYTNIGWWNDESKIREYIRVHKELLHREKPVDIQRIFVLPVMSLLEEKVQRAIRTSCKLGVKVRLLLWKTDDTKPQIKLQGKSYRTHNICYPRDIDRAMFPILPGWSGTIDDELSFLIVDKRLVSYSNIPARDRDEPSRLFTNRPKIRMHSPGVFDVMAVFERFSYRAIPADDLFPSFCMDPTPKRRVPKRKASWLHRLFRGAFPIVNNKSCSCLLFMGSPVIPNSLRAHK